MSGSGEMTMQVTMIKDRVLYLIKEKKIRKLIQETDEETRAGGGWN